MSTVIRNVRIIDGTGSVIENGFFAFDDNGIISVSKEPISADHEIDGTGKTIIPGLIDCHVHLGLLPTLDAASIVESDTEAMTAIKAYTQGVEHFKYGITTVRNMGTKYDADIYLRNLIRAKLAVGPRIVASGRVIAITGGHGYAMAAECDSTDEALKAAREQIKKGADVIKMMATGGVLTPGSVPGAQQLSYEQMKAVADEAKKTGRITGAHCIGYEGTKAAIMAGIDSIEHGYMLDDELIEMMLEKGTYLCPTIIASRVIALADDPSPICAALKKKIAPIADLHLLALERAVKAGVKIAAGTDCGTTWNPINGMSHELKYYVDAGMTEMQAIMSATKTASELLRVDAITGTLEKGKSADFVVLNSNPLDEIENVRDVECTYLEGKMVYNHRNDL